MPATAPPPLAATPAIRERPGTPMIFFSAIEPSGDRHAAELVAAIKQRRPDVQCVGLAGPAMQRAGCVALDDWTNRSAMLAGSFGLVGRALRTLQQLDRAFAAGAADLFVPVDSPSFHLKAAQRAHARQVPVVYYIAPQVWAWAEHRVRHVRQRVTRLACILPFEQEYFRSHGVDATYVGHPLLRSLAQQTTDAAAVQTWQQHGRPLITVLPGSRKHVVEEVLPGQVEVAKRITTRYRDAAFLFAAASDERAADIRTYLEQQQPRAVARKPLSYEIVVGRNAEVIAAADLVLVASGTATLEVAYHRRPMIVMYNAPRWGYQLIARWLIRTRYLSLVNILADRELVPEFMPYYRSIEPIAAAAMNLLGNESRQKEIIAGLDGIIRHLGDRNAAEETASLVLETLDAQTNRRIRAPRGSRHLIW